MAVFIVGVCALLAAGATALVYMALWILPDRRRLFSPSERTAAVFPEPATWPAVAIVVPARNEADSIGKTLPSWLGQDYPALKTVLLVDDRSQDNTGELARALAARAENGHRLDVLTNVSPPKGWAGKVWAMHCGIKHVLAAHPDIGYVLLTDADIAHSPDSLRALVGQSVAEQLGFNSRMARLRCESFAEKWLIPLFLYFFLMLYPMRRANNPRSRMATGAGGCVLLSREAIERLGEGLEPIAGCLIDDVNLAKAVKERKLRTYLSLSITQVVSTRPYPRVCDIGKMVSRSAYCQLGYKAWRLWGCLLGLAVLFLGPLTAVGVAALCAIFPTFAQGFPAPSWGWWLGGVGLAALGLQLAHFKQALNFYGLKPLWVVGFPFGGLAYGYMTFRSGWNSWRRRGAQWRTLDRKK